MIVVNHHRYCGNRWTSPRADRGTLRSRRPRVLCGSGRARARRLASRPCGPTSRRAAWRKFYCDEHGASAAATRSARHGSSSALAPLHSEIGTLRQQLQDARVSREALAADMDEAAARHQADLDALRTVSQPCL
mgnify:CR=1 FL=1